jgi:hypothetical protein
MLRGIGIEGVQGGRASPMSNTCPSCFHYLRPGHKMLFQETPAAGDAPPEWMLRRLQVCGRAGDKKTQHIAAVFEFHQPQEPIS